MPLEPPSLDELKPRRTTAETKKPPATKSPGVGASREERWLLERQLQVATHIAPFAPVTAAVMVNRCELASRMMAAKVRQSPKLLAAFRKVQSGWEMGEVALYPLSLLIAIGVDLGRISPTARISAPIRSEIDELIELGILQPKEADAGESPPIPSPSFLG